MGRVPLLLLIADAGRSGGAIGLSEEKKLDRLRPLTAGEAGSCERLSIVLSDNDGLAFLDPEGLGSASLSNAWSGSFSRNPAREDARDAERKASKSPSTSSS